jgi:hypothetical protein
MKQTFSASVTREDKWYAAQCLDVDVASQGETEEDALRNLAEALQLHYTPPCATVVLDARSLEVDYPVHLPSTNIT